MANAFKVIHLVFEGNTAAVADSSSRFNHRIAERASCVILLSSVLLFMSCDNEAYDVKRNTLVLTYSL